MAKINIYLDDKRDCPTGFVIARTVEQAKCLFKRFEVGILSLDHDLGEDENNNIVPSGYDFVKFFCENGLRADKIYIHTDNPRGREDMYETLLASQRRGFIDKDIEIYHYSITENKYTN